MTGIITGAPLNAHQNKGLLNEAEGLSDLRTRTAFWLEHGGGLEQLAELERANAARPSFVELMRPDPETLSKPMTI